MAITPQKAAKPTEQDEVVNEAPPKFRKLGDLMEDSLVAVARDALGANREMTAVDGDGRLWSFLPDGEDGDMGLRVSLAYGTFALGSSKVSASQIQCEAGDALLRSVVAILAGRG